MTIERVFRVTMIDNASLLKRLLRELRYLSGELRRAWPTLKRDPIAFGRLVILRTMSSWRRSATSTSLAGFASAVLCVFTAALVIYTVDRSKQATPVQPLIQDQVQLIGFVESSATPKDDHGSGAGSHGRVGFRKGKGEGSAADTASSHGGGSGGNHDPLPASVGKLPRPSDIPAPIPTLPLVEKQSLPAAGLDIDAALWKNLPVPMYGDPTSHASEPSNGPGDDGGMGTRQGQGVGDGRGSGFGPGDGGNTGGGPKGLGRGGVGGSHGDSLDDPDRVYRAPQVTERARVLAKPEPQYTEEARRNAVTGSVILQAVFSRTGEVTNIRAIQALPFGLTERAIAAARHIRFRPAPRDGRPVNVYMQLEYNFNLY
jgi:TonB family protein